MSHVGALDSFGRPETGALGSQMLYGETPNDDAPAKKGMSMVGASVGALAGGIGGYLVGRSQKSPVAGAIIGVLGGGIVGHMTDMARDKAAADKVPAAPKAPPVAADEMPPNAPDPNNPGPHYDEVWYERWQLLKNETWIGPEWFYLGPTSHDATRADALYVYERTWRPVETASGPRWKISTWQVS